jgi:hypothetical protein
MNAEVSVKRADLVERSLLAFDLLSYEYHFKLPCKDMKTLVDDAFFNLKLREIMYVKEELQSEAYQVNYFFL